MRIGIVGAGPAGSYAAHLLAADGAEVLLIDHKAPWEKPCGGGLTPKVLREFDLLGKLTCPSASMTRMVVISPSGRRMALEGEEPITVFSRRDLSQALLQMAEDAGVRLLSERAVDLVKDGNAWAIHTNEGLHRADFIVGADGVRSMVRRKLGKRLKPEDYSICLGYYCAGIPPTEMTVKFMDDIPGCLWVMPRVHQASAGVWTLWGASKVGRLNGLLRDFIRECYPGAAISPSPDYITPNPAIRSRERLLHGNARMDGALVGDAAGFVDAITGEGIYYALKSSHLLAESLLEGEPERYRERLDDTILRDLAHAAGYYSLFYGKGFSEKAIGLAVRRERVRRVIRDLIFGRERYSKLPWMMRGETLAGYIRGLVGALSKLFSRKKRG